jgi:hypothetical protein
LKLASLVCDLVFVLNQQCAKSKGGSSFLKCLANAMNLLVYSRFAVALLLAVPLTETAGTAQGSPQRKIDVSKLGPQVGERVPDFSLKDQTGNTQTLQSIMGPKGVMLVFVRSADW